MKNGVKADEREEILHIIRNHCMIIEGKMLQDIKCQTDAREMALWLIGQVDSVGDALRAFLLAKERH